jgi:hypothetical protein
VLDRDAELRDTLVLNVTGDQTPETRQHLAEFRARHPRALDEQAGVSQTIATEILREASGLLLLNNTRYAGVVPLKTFDYMVAGTPILAFGLIGEAGRIVEQTGAGMVVADLNPEALQAALHRLRTTPKAEWSTPGRAAWMERNNRGKVCDEMLSAMAALE